MTDHFATPNLSSPSSSSVASRTRATTTASTPSAAATVTATSTPSLPSPTKMRSNSTSLQQEQQGLLKATILSVYDLPIADQPTAVTITCCGITVTSGPPVSKHKDRNSFRFSTMPTSSTSLASYTSNNNNAAAAAAENDPHLLKLAAPLRDLYKSQMTIRVVFANNPALPFLHAEFALKDLIISQSSWHILTLKPAAPTSSTTTTTTTGAMIETTDIEPSIRIKLQLTGPYRAEIATLLTLCHAWFRAMDHVQHHVTDPLLANVSKIPLPDKKYFLLPAVPVLTTVVVASPVLAGMAMVGLPFLLPAILVVIAIAVSSVGVGGLVYAGSQAGRQHIGALCAPLVESLVSAPPLQKLLYNTGPRPTPVSVARQILPTGVWGKLYCSLLIDLIGSSSYLLPVVGEGFDVGWAPIQTILVMALFDTTSPNLKYVSFVEEILPFTGTLYCYTLWGG
jgi:hypothetical protein